MRNTLLATSISFILASQSWAHDIGHEHEHVEGGWNTDAGFVSDVDPTARLWSPRGKSPEQIEERVKFLAKSFDPYRTPEEEKKDAEFRRKFEDALVINSLFAGSAGFVGYKDEQIIAGVHRNQVAGVNLTSMTVMAFAGSADGDDIFAPARKTDKILEQMDVERMRDLEHVREAQEENKLVVAYNTQDSGQLADDLSSGMQWAEQQRMLTMNFAYNESNKLGGGGNQQENGVTPLGEDFVKLANQKGIVVDCSHSSDKTCIEAAKITTKPMMASHSNAKALLDANRNIGDEAMKAIAATGGVVCTNGVGTFLSEDGSASPEEFAKHVVYTANLIGKDKTCFASDYLHNWEDFARRNVPDYDTYAPEQGWGAPTENTTVEQVWAVARILSEDYAWTDEEVRGFLGENLMRVYQQNRAS